MTALLVIAVMVAIALARQIVIDAERMRLVAEAEHELRGPLQTLVLALEGGPLETELDRARVALADLTAARSGRRAQTDVEPVRIDRLVWRAVTASDLAARRAGGGVHLDWKAGPVAVKANPGRLAQALSNLLANAVEHGGAQIRVIGRRTTRGIRIEVRDSGRGHGLGIATTAIREAGGTLSAARAGSGTTMTIDLPVESADATPVAHLRAGYAPLASSDPPAAA